jgi:Flp pilus assembly protein CpaB
VDVVVAGERIDRGAVVSPSQLRVARLPEPYVPPGSIHDISKAAGRVLLAGLSPGEVVTENRLARVRAGPVASLVPRGLRAFAVPTSLPRGAVVAGDRVDVLATFASGQPHTEIVVESVEILLVLSSGHSPKDAGGIGLDAEGAGASAPSTLVLLVAPEQEQRLAYARAFASLEVAIVPSE